MELVSLWLIPASWPADSMSKVGSARSVREGMRLAKKLAGKGAKFIGHGGRCEFRGPNGTVYVGRST